MSASTALQPQSHESGGALRPDEQPLAHYRSIAPLAIVSVGLGLASALILTTPLLAPLPVAGIVAAIAALRSIGASDGQLAGRAPAIVGLCLATFFLGLGLTQHLARQSMLEMRAHEMAEVFLKLLEDGKSKEAHQFRRGPAMRIMAPEAIAEHYAKNPEAAKELQGFVSSSGVKELIGRSHDADARFEGVVSASHDGRTDLLVLKYSYVSAGHDPAERQPLWLHINRKFDESTKRHEWEIGGIQTTPPVGTAE